MSRKIYNKIILRWNETSHQYETAYEDSYQYDGPVDECQGFDDDLDDFLGSSLGVSGTDVKMKQAAGEPLELNFPTPEEEEEEEI